MSAPVSGPASGLPARIAAMGLIDAAMARRGGLDVAMNEPAVRGLSPEDRGFARALAMAVLRRLGSIDRILDSRLQRPPPEPVRALLRIGLAQMLYLDVPDFAAVSTTVKLAERDIKTRSFKGLINGVLRGLGREAPAEPAPDADIPPWLFARWSAQFGVDQAQAIALNARVEPPADLNLKPSADAAVLAEALPGEILPGGTVRTRRGGVLDPPVAALEAGPAGHVAAAPGGKTLQLAASGATVTALDRSEPRLRRLRANLARTGLEAEVVVADGETWADERTFDAVLLDAPCTATGTLRRNPEALYALGPAEIAKLADVQHRLLDAAAARVKPGGRLVYCVCSLEREEGETQILAFLRRNPEFALTPADADAVGAPSEALAEEGWLRLHPGQWPERGGLDGFFVARLERG